MNYSYIFGPVQSRRLGVSLGIDMVQSTICSLDCVYCECGKTEILTLERKAYADADAIIGELTDYLRTGPALNYITFGGRGEPTLDTGLGRILRFLKKEYPQYACALLTNGTMFYMPEVRADVQPFDLVLPNLDAVSEAAFRKINRPHADLTTGRIVEGLKTFRAGYHGLIWLEVFIVHGINDTPEELGLIREAALSIKPDRVQINTLDRPGACEWVTPAVTDELQRIAGLLAPLPVEIITRQAQNLPLWQGSEISGNAILSLIARRPSRIEELAALTGLTINEAGTIVSGLIDSKSICPFTIGEKTFYRTF